MAQQFPDYLRNAGVSRVRPDDKTGKVAIEGKGLHPRQFGAMVRNISTVVGRATPAEMQAGKEWYPKAHDVANEIAHGHTERGAAAIAALSPQTDWDINQQMARELPHLGRPALSALQRGDRSVLKGMALNNQSTDNVVRAHAVLHGDADPQTILGGSRKISHFARNINDPSDSASVTIDTHAHDLAVGWKAPYKQDRGLSVQGRYDTFAHAYTQASQRLGIEHNHETQAIGWVQWRNLPHPRGGSAAGLR